MALLSLDDAQNYTSGATGGNAFAAQNRLPGEIAHLAPMATTYSVQQAPQPLAQNTVSHAGTGFLAGVGHFLGSVAGTGYHSVVAASKWLATNTVNMAEAPFKAGAGIAHGFLDRQSIAEINAQNQAINNQLSTLHTLYKTGRISSKDYVDNLNLLNQDLDNLSNQARSLDNQVKLDQAATVKATIDTAATLVTVLTAGFGKAATVALGADGATPLELHGAADYLASKGLDIPFKPVENALNKIAIDGQAYRVLTPEVQKAMERSTAEVISMAGPAMTAAQISRTAAVNLAIKYPIYFNYLSGAGEQVYNDLANGKSGDALKTIGFNAGLLLSGGPIGYALKWGGKLASEAVAATFGKTTYYDELSKFYGKNAVDIVANKPGNPTAGFRTAVDQIKAAVDNPEANQKFIQSLTKESQAHLASFTPETFQDFVKNLSANEATNMGAVGGHDAVAAAFRTANGMVNQRGFNDLSHISHAEGLLDMSRMAKNQRIADEIGKSKGKGPLTVGVIDSRTLGALAKSNAIEGRTIAERNANWEAWKQANSSYAPANNPNFDKQMQNINKIRSLKERQAAVKQITAGKSVFKPNGLNKAEMAKVEKMSQEGFVIIKPNNIEAPFVEGEGKISTAFSKDNEYFVRAQQPLPVLEHLGGVLTQMGLSPQSSQQQVYQVLNENFAKNLENLPVAKKLVDRLSSNGEKEMTGNVTDYILKQLQQTKTKLPIRDYRMYNTKQIREALDITNSEATDVQNAIAKSFLQTPMAIRGLGDRVVDLTYGPRPTRAFMSRFTKIQGALRFAWNPFFTLGRLPFKTEALTEAEGGGFIRSVFTGRGGQINDIRNYLRQAGHLDKAGNFNVLSGEAVDMAGTVGSLGRDVNPLQELGAKEGEVQANLGKKLTPMQERSIAGLIDSQATRLGTDWKTYIDNDPMAVRDTIQMIAEYDKKSNFINSPLARTLNVAFFPFRFDVKVATIFARNLGKADLMTQVAVVNGLMKAHQWLQSTEGQVWYANNAQAIGLFKYLTPVASLSEAMQSLLPGHDHHLGNFGELGGLPFGWIPQLTDGEGWTHFNAPGVNAATGEVFPKYIPDTLKGQASIAIQDLVGALYSYPGATVGAPSKGSINRTIGNALTTPNKKTDFKKLTTPIDLSQQSKDYSQVIQQAQGTAPALAGPTPPPPQQQTVPALPTPTPTPAPTHTSSKSAKKKKSQFTPALLPGQSTLGQL